MPLYHPATEGRAPKSVLHCERQSPSLEWAEEYIRPCGVSATMAKRRVPFLLAIPSALI